MRDHRARFALVLLLVVLSWGSPRAGAAPPPSSAGGTGAPPEPDPRAKAPARGLLATPDTPRARALPELQWTPHRVARVPGAQRVPRGPGQPFDALRVEHAGPGKRTIRVLTIPSPRLSHRRYALMGRVRTANVQGQGFLEMWSHFPERGRFFSRTLAPEGPLRSLAGSQGWRRFALPFDASKSLKPPMLLELNVVLPGPGTVWLGPLRLVEVASPPPSPAARPHPRRRDGPPPAVPPWRRGALWWNPELGAWIGAVGGCALGVLGIALYLFGLRPRRFRLVRQLVLLAGLAGALGVTLGVVALQQEQPYDIYYPLLLLGGLSWLLAALAAWLARWLALRPGQR